MRLEGRTAASRRIKCYVVELAIPDIQIEIDEYGDVDIVDSEAVICYPALAHGPEQAIRRAIGDEYERVQSIRRIRSAGLLRAILMPNMEEFDLHRGELEEQAEEWDDE